MKKLTLKEQVTSLQGQLKSAEKRFHENYDRRISDLENLRAWCVKQQEETVVKQRNAQRTGNPHIATRESGAAYALILVIAEIDKALVLKVKKV